MSPCLRLGVKLSQVGAVTASADASVSCGMAALVAGRQRGGVCGVVLACGNAGITRSDEWFAAVEVERTDAPSCVFACGLRLM